MKYIRTKDGNIYDINKEYCGRHLSIEEKRAGPYKKEIKLIFNGKGGWFGKRIERQSDTIEELCDEFVAIRNDGVKYLAKIRKAKHGRTLELITDLLIINKPLMKSINKEKFRIYGAIWTNKGLIYVAKMNEKGEWKLL